MRKTYAKKNTTLTLIDKDWSRENNEVLSLLHIDPYPHTDQQ